MNNPSIKLLIGGRDWPHSAGHHSCSAVETINRTYEHPRNDFHRCDDVILLVRRSSLIPRPPTNGRPSLERLLILHHADNFPKHIWWKLSHRFREKKYKSFSDHAFTAKTESQQKNIFRSPACYIETPTLGGLSILLVSTPGCNIVLSTPQLIKSADPHSAYFSIPNDAGSHFGATVVLVIFFRIINGMFPCSPNKGSYGETTAACCC